MPKGSVRINKALTNMSVLYKNANYIAGDVLPNMPVMKDNDRYWIYSSDFRLPDTERANGTPSNMVEWSASTGSYNVYEHALKDVITDTDIDNTDAPINLMRDTTEYLVDKILMRQEKETADLLFTTTSFSNNTTLTSATSWKYHTTTSDPVGNVLSATAYIAKYSGTRANKAVMSLDVFNAARENPNLLDRIKYTQRGIISADLLAALFDVQSVHVGSSIYDSAKEGDTESLGQIWSDDCLLAFIDNMPSLRRATAAVNFRVMKKGNPYRVKEWRDEEIEGRYIEVQTKFNPAVVASTCGYLIKSAAL